MSTGARDAALEALVRCRRDSAWSGPVLDSVLGRYSLERREAALASKLFLGVLQNQSLCDYMLGLFCSRRPESLQPVVLDILRLGVYQLLFLDKIPSHTAVNESVALCRKNGCDQAAGLVNAVLRKVSQNRGLSSEIPGKGTAAWLAVRYSHPEWLVKRLIAEHDYAFAEAFLASNNEAAALSIQINTRLVASDDYRRVLQREGIAFEVHPCLPDCFLLPGGAVSELPGYDEGLFYVQDAAARLAVLAAEPGPGMTVLDACAAPGGKSFAAAAAMGDSGRILSCDIHENKLNRIRAGAQRLHITCIEALVKDARIRDDKWSEAFDLVLADVPCSGLGVIRKRPEIRWKPENELAGLPAIQRDILNNLSAYVRPGGVLLYSTCTVLRAENQDVVTAFLAEHPDFEAVDFDVGKRKSSGGMYSFWPHVDHTDGFFAAKLRKKQKNE